MRLLFHPELSWRIGRHGPTSPGRRAIVPLALALVSLHLVTGPAFRDVVVLVRPASLGAQLCALFLGALASVYFSQRLMLTYADVVRMSRLSRAREAMRMVIATLGGLAFLPIVNLILGEAPPGSAVGVMPRLTTSAAAVAVWGISSFIASTGFFASFALLLCPERWRWRVPAQVLATSIYFVPLAMLGVAIAVFTGPFSSPWRLLVVQRTVALAVALWSSLAALGVVGLAWGRGRQEAT